MSKDSKKRQAVALFRYGVIAPVLHSAAGRQAEYFRRMAEKELEAPGLEPRRWSAAAFKAWLRAYRRDGLEGLEPKVRSDAGRSRAIGPELGERIRDALAERPRLPASRLREELVASGWIDSRRVSEATLRRWIRKRGLRPPEPPPKPRRRYEKPHANDLWVMDFMHGPKLPLATGQKPRKTYLAAALDDHSRFAVLARFQPREDSLTVVSALKDAFARHGLPRILYCDNGSAFSSRLLTLACARLGVALVHSRPYDAPSRGKVERFFRTVRGSFLAALPPGAGANLEDLNRLFSDWLERDYHRRRHSGVGEPPLDRFMRSLASVRRRSVARQELDRVFYRTLHRTVRNDSTVSVARQLWEVPPRFIGKRVEIRHPEGRPDQLHLFEDDRPAARLHRVDAAQNATSPRRPRFSILPEED